MLSDWIENEGKSTDFGDLRLDKRFKQLLTDIYDRCRNSIPAACGGWKETLAAYRFFDNKNVNLERVLSPHYDATLERISASNVVLIAQDTTQLVREKTKKQRSSKGSEQKRRTKHFFMPTWPLPVSGFV